MKVLCPTCKNETSFENNPHRPFCSERCQLIDLGKWAQEKFAVPSEEAGTEIEQKDLDDETNTD